MKKLLTLFVLIASLNAKADPFRLSLSIAEKCKEQSAILVLQMSLPVPAEFSFLTGGPPSLLPAGIHLETKYGFDAIGASHNAVRSTTVAGQFFSVAALNPTIYIEAPKDVLCDPNSRISFLFDLADDQQKKYRTVEYKLSLDPQAVLLTEENRKEVLKQINQVYLEEFTYFLSDQFLWFKDYNDQALADFFYSIEPQYLLTTQDVATVLTNPKYSVQVSGRSLTLNFGPHKSLTFDIEVNVFLNWKKFTLHGIPYKKQN